jgi:membrane-associated phospholipid phosphatase
MWTLINNNRSFYFVYLVALLIASFFIFTTEQLQLHQHINYYVGNPILDVFFKYITHLGDGLFLIFIAVIFSFYDAKKALVLLLAYALCGGFTQFLKEVFFNFEMRPYFYHSFYHFPLKTVSGVEMHSQNSFPSGHATAAFCLFTFLSFQVIKNNLKILISVIALIVAFSRVYLSQHFTEDITAGSFIGITFTTMVIYIFYNSKVKSKFSLIEKPIHHFITKKNA